MLKVPDGCLQFHTNISGNVKSFNYNGVGCFSNGHVCDPDNLESCEFVAGATLILIYKAACVSFTHSLCVVSPTMGLTRPGTNSVTGWD